MLVEFVGNKAQMASNKHFNGQFNEQQMKGIAMLIIKKAEYIGTSDRANAGHTPARIIWSSFNGTMYALVIDGKDIKKNKATIISMYDVNNVEVKAKRFGMKKVG